MNTPRISGAMLGLALLMLAAAPIQAVTLQAAEIASPERTYKGPDGQVQPFKNDAELMEFLRTARVVSKTTIGVGINQSQKVLLEKDGIEANAIFRSVDLTQKDVRVGDLFYRTFRDSYKFEPAAYELGLRLGIINIPPAVLRRIDGRDGSLQAWVEDLLDEESETFKPPDSLAWVRQVRDMKLFDNLIYNVDRNGGNILVHSRYILVMIDHTRGFQEKTDIMSPDGVAQVNRDTWERLRNLTDQEIRDAVRAYLTPYEMGRLLQRRKVIVEYVQKLVEERGEESVVFP